MSCPDCGADTEPCDGLDENDYTIWGDCCTDECCGWSSLDEEEG